MKETTTVQLGRQQFAIAVDAHKALRQYLADIEKQPSVQAEVIEEVELRMAELLNEHGVSGEKVILLKDVEFLRTQLGEPGDFKDEDGDEKATETETIETGRQPKRLFRDPDNAMIAGVASGLAAYLGIDALIVRIILIVSTLLSGTGILIYILFWVLTPEAKTPSDRLKMQGKPVTVEAIKELVERADIPGASQRASKSFGRVLAAVAEGIARLILIVIGAALTTVSVLAMVFAVFVSGYLLFNGAQIGDVILLPFGAREVWTVILAGVTLLSAGFLLAVSGIAIIKRRWQLPAWSAATLVGVLVLAGGIGSALATNIAPHVRERIQAAHTTESRPLQAFDRIDIKGDDVTYEFEPSNDYRVVLNYIGNTEAARDVKTVVSSGSLTIDSTDFIDSNSCSGVCLYSDRDLIVTVYAPTLASVKVGGEDNSFRLSDSLSLDAFSAEMTSESDNRLDVSRANIDKLTINNAGECDRNASQVIVGANFQNITVNGNTISDANGLRNMQTTDGSNLYNCIVTR